MTLRDLIVDVMRTLWAHKLRAFLTMFGIAWGIVSIVLMVAAGEGLRKGQEEQSQTLGKDVMIVFHGRTSLQAGGIHAGRLVHWEDPDVPVVQAEGVDCEYAIPELEQETVLTHSNFNNASLEVTGSYPQFSEIRSLTVGLGRFYDWNDMREARRVAFLGSDAAKQLFPGRNPVGENVYLNDFPFVVIGVMAKKKQDSSYDGWDVNKIFIPFSAMRRDFPDKPPGTPTTFDQLLVTPKSVEQHEACKHEVRVALARMHRYDPNDKEACPIWDTVQEAKAFRQMTDGMKYFLGAVGIVTHPPARSAYRDLSGTNRRTSHRETTPDDSPPRTQKRCPPSEDDPQPTPHPTTHADHPIDPAHHDHSQQPASTGRPPRGNIQGTPRGFSWAGTGGPRRLRVR